MTITIETATEWEWDTRPALTPQGTAVARYLAAADAVNALTDDVPTEEREAAGERWGLAFCNLYENGLTVFDAVCR